MASHTEVYLSYMHREFKSNTYGIWTHCDYTWTKTTNQEQSHLREVDVIGRGISDILGLATGSTPIFDGVGLSVLCILYSLTNRQ